MFIEYDSEAQAVYIKVKAGKVVKTIEYKDNLLIDLDDKGVLLGVEILKMGDTKYLYEISQKFSSSELAKVHIENLKQVYSKL